MTERHLILLVEESNNSLGFFDSRGGTESGRVGLSLWPHEVAVSPDGRTAYVSNFGLRDYDLTLGYAGNSISVIDIASRCETHRLYTCEDQFRYWAPHGVKVTPDGKYLFVNVERVIGSRKPDLTLGPGTDQTDMLVFDLETKKPIRAFSLPSILRTPGSSEDPVKQYGVPRGSHNFVFSKDGQSLWLFSGRGGISRLDPQTGDVTAHLTDFAGAVRGLSFFKDGRLLVSAVNQLTIIDPTTLEVLWRMADFGITQILYSVPSPDGRLILAPAVWEGQVLIVDVNERRLLKSLTTGIDPVHIITSPDEKTAYVTHGRSKWAALISLQSLDIVGHVVTKGGPNGVAVSPWAPARERHQIRFGAPLPFTGQYAVEGREIRLGLEFWQEKVNASGGINIGGSPHLVDIVYADTASSDDEVVLSKCTQELLDADAAFLFGSFPNDTYKTLAVLVNENHIPLIAAHGTARMTHSHENRFAFVIGPTKTPMAEAPLRAIMSRVSPRPRSALLVVSDSAEKKYIAEESVKLLELLKVIPIWFPDAPSRHSDSSDAKQRGYFIIGIDGTIADCVQNISQHFPDVVFHFGTRSDALGLLRGIATGATIPGAVVLDCVINNSNFMASAGAALENVIGPVAWSDVIQNCSHDRFTCAEDFGRNYFDEFSEKASYYAAGAAASGVLYEHALVQAGSTDVDGVIRAIRSLCEPTFLSDIRFDGTHANAQEYLFAVQFQKIGADLIEVLVPPFNASPNTRLIWPFRQ